MGRKGKEIRTLAIAVLLMMATMFVMAAPAEAYTYNRQAAVDCAKANAYNDVPGSSYFRTHGGDCTNFVSNALKAGGWRQVSTNANPALNWYYNSLSSRSSSWAGVNPFREFAVASGRSTQVLFKDGTYYLPGTSPIKIGDIIQLDGLYGSYPDGKWDHTMIVTGVSMIQGIKFLKVTYHSEDNLDRPLLEVLNKHPKGRFRAFLLKDTYSY